MQLIERIIVPSNSYYGRAKEIEVPSNLYTNKSILVDVIVDHTD